MFACAWFNRIQGKPDIQLVGTTITPTHLIADLMHVRRNARKRIIHVRVYRSTSPNDYETIKVRWEKVIVTPDELNVWEDVRLERR